MSNFSSRRKNRRRRAPGPPPVETQITATALGAAGDGVGEWQGAPVYAPGLLPGETATVRLGPKRGDGRAAIVLERHDASPDRVEPPCPYFAQCGGCSLQHFEPSAYSAWKDETFDRAMQRKSVEPERRSPMSSAEGGRRRIRLAAIGTEQGSVFGFNAKASSRIIDIDRCIAAAPGLQEAPSILRPFLDSALRPGEKADIDVRISEAGLDVLLLRARPLDLQERETAASLAGSSKLARIAWAPADGDAPELIAERGPPFVKVGAHIATPPPGAFLQPTLEGEATMAAFASSRLKDAERIADFYSGWGAISFPLARPARVDAFEGDAAMIDALNRAARAQNLGEFLEGHVRDLARRPLSSEELKPFDGAVLDPPRSGAPALAEALAKGGPARVVYLSCNPNALARDARILIDGGYRFAEAMPIDQFRWTPHLEAAALFLR